MTRPAPPAAERLLLTCELRDEHDAVFLRRRVRQLAGLVGLDPQEQTRLATALSEVARNALQYAGGGRAEFLLAEAPATLLVRVSDRGPGIPHLAEVLEGRYDSATGTGLGLVGARRLADLFEVRSEPGAGTTVTLGKRLPPRAPAVDDALVAEIARALALAAPEDPFAELQQQNRELLRTLAALTERQAEIERLNRELEETNRGVLALYAELDEQTVELRSASELKSRFLSDMSHELRTPLNSVINIAGLLLARLDGELTGEQEKQVTLVRNSARQLIELVNDLLDIARIEAGKATLRPGPLDVGELLGTLRGMFRPLVHPDQVALVFEAAGDFPPLWTDEGRIAQILRNLIGNAVKFTEAGEIRVVARMRADGWLEFTVADTGIGIPAADRERIFREYEQVDSPLQVRTRGTGLGLPLSRKLARLLGGDLEVESEPGRGSLFRLVVPPRCPAPPAADARARA